MHKIPNPVNMDNYLDPTKRKKKKSKIKKGGPQLVL